LVSYFTPALLTNGQVLAFHLNVEFDVFTLAGIFPGVFTMFHFFSLKPMLLLFAFKAVAETNVCFWGGVSESKLYTSSLDW
jgi:hypothetical protein